MSRESCHGCIHQVDQLAKTCQTNLGQQKKTEGLPQDGKKGVTYLVSG